MSPVLTVGVPVYNAMPYLTEAMDSILTQHFRDFEILVINDGSTDDSLSYLNSLKDTRLRVLSQTNRGLTTTLNRMLHEARAPWLVRMDADDISLPGRLAIIEQQIARKPNAGMFYSRAKHHEHPGAMAMVRSTEGTPSELRRLTQKGLLLSICHSSVVLNVEKTISLGGYRFDLHVEDLDLWWRMALSHEIEFVPETTVEYRLNNMSVCSQNLRKLSCSTLYVQYLLLSHLWKLRPLPWESVQPTLDSMLDEKRFRYRETMWKAAIAVSHRKYATAGVYMLRSALQAPDRFLVRCLYPFRRTTEAHVGENPKVFVKFADKLWTNSRNSILESTLSEMTAN